MRFFSGILASIVVSLLLGFFTSVAEAQQNSCDPDGESYDARACFEYVQTLEAKNVKANSNLALARRDNSLLKSQLKAAEAQYTHTSGELRWDIVSGAMTIRRLESTVELLSEEKETAWGYVDMIMKTFAAVILLGILAGSVMLYLSRNRVADWDRYSIEARDEKIRELENTLSTEVDAKRMAQGDAAALRLELFHKKDAAALRLELFHKKADLAKVGKRYADLLNFVRQEMSQFVAIRETLNRTLLLFQTNGSRLGQLSDV